MKDVMFSSLSEEHYTPMHIIEGVDRVLHGIDLDPCADPSRRVPARRHFTKEDDGLTLPWRGTVFMNPPYGVNTRGWVNKLVTSVQQGWTTEAIALVAARTDTMFFQPLFYYPVCFIHGRLSFLDATYQVPTTQDGRVQNAPFPSALVYFGGDVDLFAETFMEIGTALVPHELGPHDLEVMET